MAPELVAGGGYGGLIREKPHCARWSCRLSQPSQVELQAIPPNPGGATGYPTEPRWSYRLSHPTQVELQAIPPNPGGATGYATEPRWSCRLSHPSQVELQVVHLGVEDVELVAHRGHVLPGHQLGPALAVEQAGTASSCDSMLSNLEVVPD